MRSRKTPVWATDMLDALDNEFFWVSRFGLSLLSCRVAKAGFAGAGRIPPYYGPSSLGLVWANASILVRHYRVHPIFALLPALLFPGLFD